MRTSAAMAPLLRREHRVQVHLGDLGEVADELETRDDQVGERLAVDRLAAAHALAASRRPGCRRASRARRRFVAGARRKVMSFSTSTSTPPRPKATSLPKLPSVTAPTMTSWPPVDHLLHLHAEDLRVGLVLLGVGEDRVVALARLRRRSSRRRCTPPASVLCRMSRRDDLQHAPESPSPAAIFDAPRRREWRRLPSAR